MKRLLLFRHAKAVGQASKSGDRGRPLNERGRADAPKMAVAMQHAGYLPDLVFCSPATRTVETWENAAPELDEKPELSFVDALYLASPKTIAQIVRAAPSRSNTLLVLGHNPGLEEFAQAAVRRPQSDRERDRLESLKNKFPTAALAVIDFDVNDWNDVAIGSGALVDFIRPKQLNG